MSPRKRSSLIARVFPEAGFATNNVGCVERVKPSRSSRGTRQSTRRTRARFPRRADVRLSSPRSPFWGPITANYDWCESNYVVTQYVAEFFNTLSSVPTLTVGLYFALKSAKHGSGFRFALAGWMLAVVGFGSVAFHGTLTRLGQVLDELPMLYSSSIFLWIAASLRFDADARGDERSARLG